MKSPDASSNSQNAKKNAAQKNAHTNDTRSRPAEPGRPCDSIQARNYRDPEFIKSLPGHLRWPPVLDSPAPTDVPARAQFRPTSEDQDGAAPSPDSEVDPVQFLSTCGKGSVTYQQAAKLLGCGVANIRKLVRGEKLVASGKGTKAARILVESITTYLGLQKNT
jgi:hypothetical protein